jgi:NAD(P)-dependent dehydrogenase (short-subunit alcohol dehydrogenase family)
MRQVSSDPKNTFIGLVRDNAATEKRVTEELGGRPNIHILRADLTSHDDLKQAAADTASLTGGSIDYLVSNAGWPSLFDAFVPIGALYVYSSTDFGAKL